MTFDELRRSERNRRIICQHISYPERPILYAARGTPLEANDSGWQFLCGLERAHDFNDAAVWLLKEVALDATLRSILDAEPKMSFERLSAAEPWRQVPYDEERDKEV